MLCYIIFPYVTVDSYNNKIHVKLKTLWLWNGGESVRDLYKFSCSNYLLVKYCTRGLNHPVYWDLNFVPTKYKSQAVR
jgi:hypothetical protein